jgi:hypothetical protein
MIGYNFINITKLILLTNKKNFTKGMIKLNPYQQLLSIGGETSRD